MGKSEIKRELKKLAIDFELLDRPEVVSIIQNSISYNSGQRELLKIYDQVYLKR